MNKKYIYYVYNMTRYMDLSPDNNVLKQSEEKCV